MFIRVAPAPFYNTFEEWYQFVEVLKKELPKDLTQRIVKSHQHIAAWAAVSWLPHGLYLVRGVIKFPFRTKETRVHNVDKAARSSCFKQQGINRSKRSDLVVSSGTLRSL